MEQEQPNQNLHHSKWVLPVVIGGLALLILAGAAYAALQTNSSSPKKTAQVTKTPSPSVTVSSTAIVTTTTMTPIPTYTVIDSNGENTFTGLGVSFQYDDFDKIANQKTASSVTGNKVVIGDSGNLNNSLLTLEVYDKSTQDVRYSPKSRPRTGKIAVDQEIGDAKYTSAGDR